MASILRSAVVGALLAPIGSAALAQTQSSTSQTAAPFVEISISGSEVVSSPQRIRYRVSADPGTYVTVFEISPIGRVSVLNAYDEALRGRRRTEFYREAFSGYQDGEGYLVAVATRSKADHSRLVGKSFSRFSWAGRFPSAESSLNDLLMNFLPAAVNEFGADFVAFRVLTFGGFETFADALYCPLPFYSRSGYLSGYGYYNPGYVFRGSSFARLNSERYCYDSQRLIARAPFPVSPPIVPGDTTSKSDTATRLSPPHGIPFEPPVTPSGRSTVVEARSGIPIGEPAGVPVERDGNPLTTFSRPAAPSIPIRPSSPPTVEPPVFLPARPTPVAPERREPVVVAPETKPFRPLPVETERREPTQPAPPRIETPITPVMSSSPPPPPPHSVSGGDAKVLQPTTIPPA